MVTRVKIKQKRTRTQGQALVETAILGIFLALLLAAAVDLGRVFHTAVVVENMAGEGVAYAARYPDRDLTSPQCSETGVLANQNIQDRARRVAADRGMMIRQPAQADIRVSPLNCTTRCSGVPITVTVTYRISDLFLPNVVGMRDITITKAATQYILDSVMNDNCPPP